ncbi:hypothetical protein K461DRAFT_107096 [Myriangium duriaei CBS 260.36]|uniref:Uncharacterized protein n=1 Tax=Myriangium duriaei CBS 260.36 TaxID=1168546 RepID=A0A9P4MPW4_9PEZI|nr:hypothetical protein K461DRAFT_107096 [Myriangium duriaei CBS 260.36]
MADAPPRPPPHAPKTSNLPNGNYDVFIIPPHSAGSGFLYLPSLKPNLNSFIAGFFSALLAVGVYNVLMPALSQTIASLNSGIGLLLTLVAVAAAFSVGRTTSESTPNDSSSSRSHHHRSTFDDDPQYPRHSAPPPQSQPHSQPPPPPPPPPPQTPRPGAGPSASSTWEKAREETRKREAERKKAEEAKAAAELAAKKKAEAEKAAKAKADKERWEQTRAREKDAREREARERIAKERAAREAAAKGAAASPKPTGYEKPTARTATDSDFVSQYNNKKAYGSSAGSVSGASESSWASASTARTTPPPSQRGPYKTADPNKIVIDAVYLFASGFARPMSMLVKEQGGVTDGLILRITTEGLFIDDDVRGVPQREWDVKAWGIKLVETGRLNDINIFRATLRDVDEKKYIFVLPTEQSWKVDVGLERLRKGSQVRAMGMNMIKEPEMKKILSTLGGAGWM